jgi:rRNA-processing protein FCF1
MTPEEIYYRACSQNGLIIDTNLLILLLVGRYEPTYLKDCPRTCQYSVKDFVFIENLVNYTNAKIIVTPHILAELSNLTFDKMLYGRSLEAYISQVINTIKGTEERHTHKDKILANDLLKRLGFADLSVIEASSEHGCAVMTDDDKLYKYLCDATCPAMNLKSQFSIEFSN